jgi:UDP-GlcNAc:undecaprenyl-phosphate/decaprenyl-phosphate GlcNAc-1-phosphate transferase
LVSAITAFVIALAVVIAVTPLVRRFALDVGAIDRPGDRRVHGRAIPRLGGIALVVAFFAPLLVLFGLETEVARKFFADPLHIVGLVTGGLIITGLGVFDDVRGVRAWTKLWVQLLAACIAYACGFRIEAVAVPLLGHLDMGIFALPVTALWIVAIVNALNLIDGLDGLAGGVAFFACVANFVVGAINGDSLVMLLSASLGGAVLGFLLFNFNPASIFMGDSGSLFLGYVLATTSILGSSVKSSTTVAILVPLIALGLPLMDTLFAMLRRVLERRPIFSADRGHIHHQLLAMGVNHRRAVLILYGLSILFTAGAILLSMGRDWQVGSALLVLSVAVVGVVRSMGSLHLSLRRFMRRERVRPPSVERLRRAVPDALAQIAGARDAREVSALLAEFGRAARFEAIELTASQAQDLPSFIWTSSDSWPAPVGQRRAPALRDAITAVFTVPAAGTDACLRFSWTMEQSDASPEADILLQLVADAVDGVLLRGRQRLTPVVRGKSHLRSV